MAQNTRCKDGFTSIAQCRRCDLYTDCATCNTQPDCVFCNNALGPNGLGTCTGVAACATPYATCQSECAEVKTCEGCQVLQDCTWTKDQGCQGLLRYALKSLSCPGPGGFDGGSFVGGMFFVIGLGALAAGIYFVVQWYRRHHGHQPSSLVVQ